MLFFFIQNKTVLDLFKIFFRTTKEKFSKDKTIFLYISKNNFTIEDATFLKTRKTLDRYITSNISIYCTTNKFISYYRPKYYRLQSKKDKLIAEINVEKDVEAKAAQNVDTAE